jgi:PhoPQ-activated pathogenicity-related protein
VAMRSPLPKLTWKHDDDGGRLRLTIHSQPAPKAVHLWVAHSEDKDFRPDKWTSREISPQGDNQYLGHVERPASGHVAFYAEANYEFGPLTYGLSTQIRQQ